MMRKKVRPLKKHWSLLALLVGQMGYAHVRQRVFLHDSKDSKYGTESIVKWADDDVVKISMHQFSGNLGSGSTNAASLNASAIQSLIGDAISQWSGNFLGMSLPLSLDLDAGLPYLTSSGCESPVGDEGNIDGVNNVLFESKINTTCSEPINTSGVIGVTKIRYSVSRGTIVEGDIQFDDNTFLFVSSGSNNLSSTPKQINLRDAMVHEFGHYFGLDHSSVRQSTMLFAVAENMQTTKSDDKLGLYSLYPPSQLASNLGTLSGSVRDAFLNPVFGAVVFALDARTLEVVASEMTNVNGAFEFCALPAGSYVVYVNRYSPFDTSIHSYYSGFGDSTELTYLSGGVERCFNPGCVLMTDQITHTFWSRSSTTSGAVGGMGLKVVNVVAGAKTSFLNITAQSSIASLDDVPSGSTSSSASVIDLDEPRIARLSQTQLALVDPSPPSAVGTDQYYFSLTGTEKIRIATSSLRIYSRLRLKLELFDSASIGGTDLATQTQCTANSPNVAQATVSTATDPVLVCDLPAGNYIVRVTGNPVDCQLVPGNSLSCANAQVGESASTNIPYYFLVVTRENLVGSTSGHTLAQTLDAESLASTTISNLPSCGDSSLQTSNANLPEPDGDGGCCGTIRDISKTGGPKPGHTFWMSVFLNPAFLYALYGLARGRFKLGQR